MLEKPALLVPAAAAPGEAQEAKRGVIADTSDAVILSDRKRGTNERESKDRINSQDGKPTSGSFGRRS